MKAHVSVCLGESLSGCTCVHPCVGASEPPIPQLDGHQLGAVQPQPRPSPAPGHRENDHKQPSPPAQQCSPTATSWSQTSFLAEKSKISLYHLGLEGRQGESGLERGSGGATQRDHLSFVPPAPLSPPPPLRLRVHCSGDPWELEANFPRSLVMERPQVLPLIKVKCGAEEKRCTQASSSRLQKPYANN